MRSSLPYHEEPVAHEKLLAEWKVEVVVLHNHFEPHPKPDHAGLVALQSSAQV